MSRIIRSRFIQLALFGVLAVCYIGAGAAENAESDDYWKVHSLVFARVEAVTPPKGDGKPFLLVLGPKLRLSGELDPSKHPEITVEADVREYSQDFKLRTPGLNVLVLLVRRGDSYELSKHRADFMPGDHAPLCEVNDVSDKEVMGALKAVQELRKKEKRADSKPATP